MTWGRLGGVCCATLLVATLLFTGAAGAGDALPVLPGAAGFGMETPAGSGRHLRDVSLEAGWDQALVGRWDFDAGKPGGTLEGDAALVARGQGKALRVNGQGYLSLASAGGAAKAGGSFTIVAWVYMEKPYGSVAASVDEGGANWEISHVKHGVGKWRFGAKGAQGQTAAYWPRDVDEPKWRHVAGVYDGESGNLRLYIDACLVAATRKGVKGLAAARSSHLTLGKGLKGLVDDVLLFNAALTQGQIVALHARRHDAYLGPDKTRIIKVTNLNTEGPGSLREALEAVGPRVVVFEVSGNIDFTPLGGLSIRHPYITVAGQTAPSPGITLKACELSIGTHDVLLQHIRIRTGDLLDPKRPVRNKAGWSQWSERDCMKVSGDRIVIDHCSFSWSTDELVQTTARRITFRRNLFGECLNSPKHHKGAHSKGLLILDQGDPSRVLPESERHSRHVAVLGNLFACNADRHPQATGGAKVAIINNFVYGVTARPGVGITLCNASPRGSRGGEIWATVVGNHFDNVPAPLRLISRPEDVHGKVFLKDMLISYTPAERRAHEALIRKTVDDKQFQDYLAGQQWPGKGEGGLIHEHLEAPWNASHMLIFKHWMGKPIQPMTAKATEPPVIVPGLQIRPAGQVREWTLANAGARPADRDPADARIVAHVRARTGTILKSQDDVGGWPELPQNRRKLTTPDNPSGDDDGDGYTNLEEWLHGYAAEVEGRKK